MPFSLWIGRSEKSLSSLSSISCDFLSHDGMRARRFARGKPPVMCVVFVMRVGEKLGESFAEGKAGPRKDAGEQAEGSLTTF